MHMYIYVLYIYMCMYIHMYIHMYVHIYTYTHGFTWMCMCYDRKFDDIPIFGDGHQSIDKD